MNISILGTCVSEKSPYLCRTIQHNENCSEPPARVAQLVERDLAKVEVASSNLVSRSKLKNAVFGQRFLFKHNPAFWVNFDKCCPCRSGGMVYTRDLKSLAFTGLRVRVPSPVLTQKGPTAYKAVGPFLHSGLCNKPSAPLMGKSAALDCFQQINCTETSGASNYKESCGATGERTWGQNQPGTTRKARLRVMGSPQNLRFGGLAGKPRLHRQQAWPPARWLRTRPR